MRKAFLALLTILLLPIMGASGQSDRQNAVVHDNAAFAFDLYQLVREEETGNFLYSPYSMSQAFAMLYGGARGETATQMAQALHYNLPDPDLHEVMSDLNALMTTDTLKVANSVWVEQTYPLLGDYMSLLAQYYTAFPQSVDFINQPQEARQTINDWVAERTEDRIQDLLPENSIDPMTRLVLTNALHFKDEWATPFGIVEQGEFTLLDGDTVTVPMMTQEMILLYVEGDGFRAVQLPFRNSLAALVLILPDDFEAFEADLNADWWTQAAEALNLFGTSVLLTMPQFEFTSEMALSTMLKTLGMTDAFDPLLADFSGIAEIGPNANLYVVEAYHKAFIKVDENGAEAAAATGIVVGVTSAPSEPPIELRFDRPFIFALRDTNTGSLLFIGRVMNPAEIVE